MFTKITEMRSKYVFVFLLLFILFLEGMLTLDHFQIVAMK